jgi:hypothetical protein
MADVHFAELAFDLRLPTQRRKGQILFFYQFQYHLNSYQSKWGFAERQFLQALGGCLEHLPLGEAGDACESGICGYSFGDHQPI